MEEDYPTEAVNTQMTQLKYRVTADQLRTQFRKKEEACLRIAKEWSKKDDNPCAHGIVIAHEQNAEKYHRRAELLADGTYLLTGDLLDAIFSEIETPVDQPEVPYTLGGTQQRIVDGPRNY